MFKKIEELKAQLNELKAENEEALEALRIKYLSKKGEITALFNEFRTVPAEQKKELGQKLNELKNLATNNINALKETFKAQEKEKNKIDITRPAFPAELGTRHPISVVRKQIIDIFSRLGFTLADGPEVEDDWHVFSALNFAADHPARDMQDTFFIE
ncbi:MAG: phenylalanine--tRNA ligase subunit alpha, partial [Muribaculaceae bacterium]|nr:phenylalanine--tRNA ligase subunit alpha [Muribaculaceae bacterium]